VHALAPHLVVVSGDLTQRAKNEQFAEARAFLETLPHPQVVVPGNHDVPLYNVVKRFAAPLANYKRAMGEDVEPTYIDDEIAVIGVNTARSFVFKGGRINEEQVERVRAAICQLPEEVTKVLVTHHPFDVPAEDDEHEHQIVGRARMALERLAGCGADVLLSGHLHEASVTQVAERFRIAGISALVVQAGTATSERTRETPNTFNALTVSAGTIEVRRFAWNGADFVLDATDAFLHGPDGWHPQEPAQSSAGRV
jgi:3',5'-cyclic AMP phosphodiesterase CpdA